MAYAVSAAGSDWQEWQVRDVATGKDLPDVIKWSKFSGASWLKDGSGFYYGRYDAPKDGNLLQAVNKNQKVYFHAVGTPQEKDVLVYERPDKPDWGFGGEVTDDGRFLLVYQTEGTDNRNRDLRARPQGPERDASSRSSNEFDAAYTVVGNDGDIFYVLTEQRRAAVPARGHRPDEPGAGGLEDAHPRGAGPRRARRRRRWWTTGS